MKAKKEKLKSGRGELVQTSAPGREVVAPQTLAEIGKACFQYQETTFTVGRTPVRLPWRLLTDSEMAALDLHLAQALPKLIKDAEGKDVFDIAEPGYLKRKAEVEGEAACLAVFWACPVIGKEIPELARVYPAMEGPTQLGAEQVAAVVELVRHQLTPNLITQIYRLAREDAGELERLVNFTSPVAWDRP